MCPAPKSFDEKIQYLVKSFNVNFYKTLTYTFMHSYSFASSLYLAYLAKDEAKIRSIIGNIYLRLLTLCEKDFPVLPSKEFKDLELFTLTKNGLCSVTFEVPDCLYESQIKYICLTWPSSSIDGRRVYNAELYEETNELGLALATAKGHYLFNTRMCIDIAIEDFAEIALNEFSNTLMWETSDLKKPPKV